MQNLQILKQGQSLGWQMNFEIPLKTMDIGGPGKKSVSSCGIYHKV